MTKIEKRTVADLIEGIVVPVLDSIKEQINWLTIYGHNRQAVAAILITAVINLCIQYQKGVAEPIELQPPQLGSIFTQAQKKLIKAAKRKLVEGGLSAEAMEALSSIPTLSTGDWRRILARVSNSLSLVRGIPNRETRRAAKRKKPVTRKQQRRSLADFKLVAFLIFLINHYFPGLLEMLKELPANPGKSETCEAAPKKRRLYTAAVICMTRIVGAIFHAVSMRAMTQELNTDNCIHNMSVICGEHLEELPHWSTINNYLEQLDPEKLSEIVAAMAKDLIRSKAFYEARIRGTGWQLIIDGTQLYTSKDKPQDCSVRRNHETWVEVYQYAVEAKIVLADNITISVATEFVEGERPVDDRQSEWKQDCERTAAMRLLEKIKRAFPRLPIVISADSLYACGPFIRRIREYGWQYLLNFRTGSIPTVGRDYEGILKAKAGAETVTVTRENGEILTCDFANDIEYEWKEDDRETGKTTKYETKLNCASYTRATVTDPTASTERCYVLTSLPLNMGNVAETVMYARRRWNIEECFKAQKEERGGYCLKHAFSHNGTAMKNHYLLIQIGHAISQVMDAWHKPWENNRDDLTHRHRRMLDAWRYTAIDTDPATLRMQIRFQPPVSQLERMVS